MSSYQNKFVLKDKVACVLGGAGLLGKEITTALSQAGAKTNILDIDRKKSVKIIEEMKEYGSNVGFIKFDSTDLKHISKNLKKIFSTLGSIDVFVNCSYPRTKDWSSNNFKNINFDSFSSNIDIHMKSYAWSAREVAEIMTEQKNGGSIILLASIYGMLGQDLTIYEGTKMNENMSYSIIKGGIINLSRQMASYYGKYNIRVNTICPGGIFDNQEPIFVENYSNKTPLKRMGEPDEIASAALFLASDASSYVTGSALMVDGGWSAV